MVSLLAVVWSMHHLNFLLMPRHDRQLPSGMPSRLKKHKGCHILVISSKMVFRRSMFQKHQRMINSMQSIENNSKRHSEIQRISSASCDYFAVSGQRLGARRCRDHRAANCQTTLYSSSNLFGSSSVSREKEVSVPQEHPHPDESM